jgi:hypothetical protein
MHPRTSVDLIRGASGIARKRHSTKGIENRKPSVWAGAVLLGKRPAGCDRTRKEARFAKVVSWEPLMDHERNDRLAGFVMGVLTFFTYATTSPFGVVLCYEKLREPKRGEFAKWADRVGLGLSLAGCLYLGPFLVSMFNYSLIGPQPVMTYVVFVIIWTWYRVRVVWPRRGQATARQVDSAAVTLGPMPAELAERVRSWIQERRGEDGPGLLIFEEATASYRLDAEGAVRRRSLGGGGVEVILDGPEKTAVVALAAEIRPELAVWLPKPPLDAVNCGRCVGSGGIESFGRRGACPECLGLGWR